MVAPDDPRHEDDPDEGFRADAPTDAPGDSGTDARLALGDDDGRLPWLEGDEEDEAVAGGIGQLLPILLISVLVLGLIVGGIWWATHRGADQAVVADGSTIQAPAEPYKERPADPGGKTFDGTGDTSFAISEGRDRPATIEPAASPAPRPGFETLPKAAASVAPAAVGTAAAAGGAAVAAAGDSGGVGVQVGAYSSRSAADAGWKTLAGRYEALAAMKHRVVEGRADIGTVYRLQAVAADATSARALCSRLQGAGLACQVKN